MCLSREQASKSLDETYACLLSSKIFTLPLHFQMLLGKCFSGFLAVSRLLLFTGESSLETFQLILSFAVVSGVGNGSTLGVGQVRQESNINPKLSPRCNVLNFAGSTDTKTE